MIIKKNPRNTNTVKPFFDITKVIFITPYLYNANYTTDSYNDAILNLNSKFESTEFNCQQRTVHSRVRIAKHPAIKELQTGILNYIITSDSQAP